MEDVARKAGVSRALVSLVLNESPKVSARRRQAVLDACADLGYRRNAAARQLASRHNGTIGVMFNDLHNPFFAEIYDGIERLADDAGLQLLFTMGQRTPEREQRAIDNMIEHRVDGMILVSPRLASAAVVTASRVAPAVVIGRVIAGPHIDSVANDEHHGALMAVSHLVQLGHRSIVHVHGGAGAGAQDRSHGYERVMRANGLEPDVVPGDFTEAAGIAAAEVLLKRRRRPTAVFAANDLVAAGVLDTFESADLRVPADVSIVGYDNNVVARMRQVGLTTIDQTTEEMGRVAFELLQQRIDDPDRAPVRHLVTPTLVARRTSGPAPAAG
jgi:DNA-binding LacI/PurR family transcriptional regulator